MKWTFSNDSTRPIISAEKRIQSQHGKSCVGSLPQTCVIFEIGMALKFIESNYETIKKGVWVWIWKHLLFCP